jgi:hypothetical protein
MRTIYGINKITGRSASTLREGCRTQTEIINIVLKIVHIIINYQPLPLIVLFSVYNNFLSDR